MTLDAYAECHIFFTIMQSVIMLSVIMLSVIILSVVAPLKVTHEIVKMSGLYSDALNRLIRI